MENILPRISDAFSILSCYLFMEVRIKLPYILYNVHCTHCPNKEGCYTVLGRNQKKGYDCAHHCTLQINADKILSFDDIFVINFGKN